MNIPPLVISTRTREYDKYTDIQKANIVYALLFEDKAYRTIDKEVLGLDSSYTKGYQSMGVAHHLGLTKPFMNLFDGLSLEQGIDELKAAGTKYADIVAFLEMLKGTSGDTEPTDDDKEGSSFDDIAVETNEEFEVKTDGKKTQYYTTRYERNPLNRKQAIDIHGTSCMVCGFNFGKIYGERGRDYIEVHHVVPLSEKGEEVTINPSTDLVVVCSNCHRMIHRKKNEILSIDDLKKIINDNK